MNKRVFIVGLLMVAVLMWVAGVTAVLSVHQPLTSNNPIYSTFLGDSAPEEGRSITFDAGGNAYIVGFTESTTFPTSTIPFNREHNGQHGGQHGIDVYVAKFNADATDVEYIFWFNAATLFAEDYAYDIAVDSNGSAYVTGDTHSGDLCSVFGTVPGYDQSYNDNGDAFALKINPAGTALEYCTFLGGNDLDIGRAITVDEEGHAYVTGWTRSTDFYTTTDAFDTNHDGGVFDGFLLKLNATGDTLDYATFLGGTGEDKPTDLHVDDSGYVYVGGYTNSADFYTTTNALDTTYNGGYDGFVLKMNPQGNQLLYSTYLGGDSEDWGWGLDVDGNGVAYLVGETWSSDFPTTTLALDGSLTGGQDAFVAQLATNGTNLLTSSYLGGSDWDHGFGIAADGLGHVYVTGETRSADFPISPSAYDNSHNGNYDIFVTKLRVVQANFPAYLPLVIGEPSFGKR